MYNKADSQCSHHCCHIPHLMALFRNLLCSWSLPQRQVGDHSEGMLGLPVAFIVLFAAAYVFAGLSGVLILDLPSPSMLLFFRLTKAQKLGERASQTHMGLVALAKVMS